MLNAIYTKLYHCFIFALALFSSCSEKEYYTSEDFYSIKKVDTHIHPNTENTAFAEQAKKDNFIIIAVNVEAPHYPSLEEQLRLALLQKDAAPEHVEIVNAISMDGWGEPGWAEQEITRLRKGFAKGALGTKFWKNIGMVYKDSAGNFIMIDDPSFDPVVKFIIEQDKTVMGHIGEPKNCWLPLDSMTVNGNRNYYRKNPEYHMYLHPENPSYEELIDGRDRFVEKHPDMRFVGAHLGSLEWSVDALAQRLDRFPNMVVDMAARISHFQYQSQRDREKVRDFIIRYKDRLLYATDEAMSEDSDPEHEKVALHNRWIDDWKYLVTDETMTSSHFDGELQGLKLPKDVVDHIYYQNAVKWFKIPQ